jgi:hypothetical protein
MQQLAGMQFEAFKQAWHIWHTNARCMNQLGVSLRRFTPHVYLTTQVLNMAFKTCV